MNSPRRLSQERWFLLLWQQPVTAMVLSLGFGGAFAIADDSPLVLTPAAESVDSWKDSYSGKTLESGDMAFEMIRHRQVNAPRVGEIAPEFWLHSLKRGRRTGLDELIREKPFVLLFASWGCDVFRESHGGLFALHKEFGDAVDFVLIYTREIHPLEGFAGELGRVADPVSDIERREVAARCQKQLRVPFEVLVDDIDDPVATRWAGIPVRLFVVEKDRRVVYAGAQGPWGYRPYEGFLHGDGRRVGIDHEFDASSLESFLRERYGASVSADPDSDGSAALETERAERTPAG